MPRLGLEILRETYEEPPSAPGAAEKKFVRTGNIVFFNPGGKEELKHKTIVNGEMLRAGVNDDPDDAGYFERIATGEIVFKDESRSLGIGTDMKQREITGNVVRRIAEPDPRIKILVRQSRFAKPITP